MPASERDKSTLPHAAADAATDPGFGIYIHWPFCTSKCPYCDFNVHLRDDVDHAQWRRALAAELAYFAECAPDRTVTSVFFGGGTPSLMEPATAAACLDALARHFSIATDCEVTLEANPEDRERFAAFRTVGVTRLSLGLQSLEDHSLARLGRHHSGAEGETAVAAALRLFPEVSCDLIYARPGQTIAAWRTELGRVLALGTPHLSLYQLTVEPGTAFHREQRRGTLIVPDDDTAAGLFALSQELCEEAGLPAYEISNHAAPGHACRHNLVYWQGGDYLGIGPGAHGRITLAGKRHATETLRHPETWLEAVAERGHGVASNEPLEREAAAAERLMMGLRLKEGVMRAAFTAHVGRPLEDFVDGGALGRLCDEGFLVLDEHALRATARGRAVLNAVLGALIA